MTGISPYIFLSHRGPDKPLLETFIGRIVDEGVSVFIDRTGEFSPAFAPRVDGLIHSGLIRSFVGGEDWTKQAKRAIINASCTVGFISNRSTDPDNEKVGNVPFREMSQALELGRLVTVELESGAVKRFRNREDLDATAIGDLHYLPLRPTHFGHDYARIGEAVAKRSKGVINFGGAFGFDELVEHQSRLAERLRGSAESKSIVRYDFGTPIQCRLVPLQSPGTDHFWFTTSPIVETPIVAGQVQRILTSLPVFRLPTVAEVERALAPLGRHHSGANPFGFGTFPSAGVWAYDGHLVVVGGGPNSRTALLHLTYVR